MPRPAPYLPAKAGELVTAELWNELQVRTREELASGLRGHEASSHASDPQNPTVRGLSADTVRAGAIQGDTVRGASMSADALAASTATLGVTTIKDLKVTGAIDAPNLPAAGAPQVWHTHLHWPTNSGGHAFASNLNVQFAGKGSRYGCYLYSAGSLGQWAAVIPQMKITVSTAGLLVLSASWFVYEASGNTSWVQFVIGTPGRFAPVRTYPTEGGTTHCGDYGDNAWTYQRPALPTASTLSAWLDYHWASYCTNAYRWPMAGLVTSSSTVGSAGHQDCIEVPAGSYTINIGLSGCVRMANLQLTATFYPGGTSR